VLLRATDDPDAVVAIGQASHAWLSGQLARAWRDVEPREAVCLAAEQHDVGMAAWDLAPTLNAETGRPHDFLQMPLETHLRLWSAAPQRLLTQSRYAALLVSLHGTTLYEMRDLSRLSEPDADAVRAYLAGQRALQERLTGELGADREQVERNRRLLFTWDWLSLALCLDWSTPREGPEGFTLHEGGLLDPWPFAEDAVSVHCEGRRLEGRFETVAALHAGLERAQHVELCFTLLPVGRAGA
jgi:hypothetical protein